MDKYLIDGHKLYWHLDRVKEWQEERFIPSIYIEVSPVSFCNQRCIFCGLDFAMQERFQLKTDILCNRLKEMAELGVRSIMFAGEGEPLLHKGICRLIRTAGNSGMDVAMTTNGSIDNPLLWEKILPHLVWLRFSIDAGSPDVYARIHNVKKTFFAKTINSVKQALKIKRRYKLSVTIGIQFLLIEENLTDVENAIRLFSKIGVDYLSFKPYSLHPQMLKRKDTIYTNETIKYVQDLVDKYKEKTKLDIIFRRDALEKYMHKDKKFSHCRALAFWGYISSKGDFYSCSVFINDRRFKVGNIYDNDMRRIMFGDLRKKSIIYGERRLNIEECRLNCRMARINEFLEFLENKPNHINFI